MKQVSDFSEARPRVGRWPDDTWIYFLRFTVSHGSALCEQQLDIKLNRMMRPRDARAYLKSKFAIVDAAKGLSGIRESFSTPLVILMAIVCTLLLIACGNAANLMVARATTRQKEIAVRPSMGASTAAIIRIILIESLILSFPGGALGLLFASWSESILLRALPFETFSNVISTEIDERVLLFTLAVSAVTAVLFGFLPALQAAKPNLFTTLKSEAKSVVGGPLGFRKAMVVAQMTLSLLLLIVAGLFTRSFYKLMHAETGMRSDHVLSFSPNRPCPVTPIKGRVSCSRVCKQTWLHCPEYRLSEQRRLQF